ncbi:hypothetical protein QYF36_024015 [Acer negundo]|nr:hypothetical protein QYF36_024015 [Acer negundo]
MRQLLFLACHELQMAHHVDEKDGLGSADDAACMCTTRLLVHSDHVTFLTGRQQNVIQEEIGVVLSISSVGVFNAIAYNKK